MALTLLDGAMGTELIARGFVPKERAWTAFATVEAPDLVRQIHRDYAAAGATVHTANTFRAKRRSVGDEWLHLAEQAVMLAREAVPFGHRVAGSIAPLEDCYRPDLSPPRAGAEHRELADALVSAGVDLLLCETFANTTEAMSAVDEAIATGLETWLSLTAGPDGSLASARELAYAATAAEGAGAKTILINCTAADRVLPFLRAIRSKTAVALGVYANGGDARAPIAPAAYVAHARKWVDAGATVIGGCCGASPAHISALRAALL